MRLLLLGCTGFIVSELVKMHKGELLCLENIPNGSNFEINIPK